MRGLVIGEPWIGLILAGKKTWEMRPGNCTMRGPIALIKKGTGHVVGVAEILGALSPLRSAEEYAKAEQFHAVPLSEQPGAIKKRWTTPWVLRNARALSAPAPYKHKNGAQAWVILEPGVVEAIQQRAGMSHRPV
jgi:hypothetical protein